MENLQFSKIKAIIIGIVIIFIFGFLFWEHFNGGVTSHHILQQKDLPSISNWWSGLLLPLLTWFLLSRVEKRFVEKKSKEPNINNTNNRIFLVFLAGLVFGILLSISFTYEFKPFLDNTLYFLIVLSFVIPVFYSEFMLGFILGMTYTFGAIIPSVFILIIAGIGLIAYKLIRPIIFGLVARLKKS